MAAPNPGIVYVTTKFRDSTPSDEEVYLEWVKKNMNAVASTPSIQAASLYKNLDPNAETTLLLIYGMPDISVWGSEQFQKAVRERRQELDEQNVNFDMVDVSVRNLAFEEMCGKARSEHGSGKFLIAGALELGGGLEPKDLHEWYTQEAAGKLESISGFIRSTRFKLTGHLKSTETRAARGLPPREGEVITEEPATWHALHEFDINHGIKFFMDSMASDWSTKFFQTSTKTEFGMYELVESLGKGPSPKVGMT